jgi:cobalamin biosynthesis protein CbiD
MTTVPWGWSTCELGDRTPITSKGGSGIGVVTTIKSGIDVQPAS